MMPLRVSGKNIDIGETLRTQIIARIIGVVEKFFGGGMTGHVTLTREGSGFETDCVLHLSSGVTLQAFGVAQDPYLSAEKAADKIETRLRRYKRRIKEHAHPNGKVKTVEIPAYVIKMPDEEEFGDDDREFHPIVVAETKKNMRTLSISEAVVDLDLTGAPVVLFRHAGSGRVNIVYRRDDGNIGWVDPPALEP